MTVSSINECIEVCRSYSGCLGFSIDGNNVCRPKYSMNTADNSYYTFAETTSPCSSIFIRGCQCVGCRCND